MDFAYILVIAFAVFLVVFIKTEFGLYLVIFSMLLSPKLGSGSGELAERVRAAGYRVRVALQPGEALTFTLRLGSFATSEEGQVTSQEPPTMPTGLPRT